MSHEIRTPLNGIVGMTEIALGTQVSQHWRPKRTFYAEVNRDFPSRKILILAYVRDASPEPLPCCRSLFPQRRRYWRRHIRGSLRSSGLKLEGAESWWICLSGRVPRQSGRGRARNDCRRPWGAVVSASGWASDRAF
jgi:hypothetical protein